MNIQDKIRKFPDEPGIYLFYNLKKELIYIGKATSLKNRVRSYFVSARTSRPIEQMIHEVVDIKTIKTDSVLEAIILEANYIKKFQPKYNVDLKDDKSWNYILISKDLYPRVSTVRQHEINNNKFPISNFQYNFGPYPGLKTREMMKILHKLFYISACESNQARPCFYYQLGQCLGVCTGEISSKEYKKKVIKPLVQFLSGKKKGLLINLQREMKTASKNNEFEEAGRLRDQINNLQKIQDIALLNKSFLVNNSELRTSNSEFRIEGYDISNLGTSGKVGGMVVFDEVEPIKSEYRKFKIKTVIGQSDVDCLAEVIGRRLNHGEWKIPNIILVDGGLPQVNRAVEILRLKKFKIPVVGIAKGPARKKNEFFVGYKDREFIKWVNKNQKLLIQIRDEAHRFAIKYQKSLRKI